MIAYLPTIYPDELMYSWLSRYYVHSGYMTFKMAAQELYCNRADNPSKEFMGNLNPDARKTIAKVYPMDMLVQKHTMFPQYARFIPLEQRKMALHHIGHDWRSVHQMFCILPRYGNDQYLHYCILCVLEDRNRFGETYWHRKHQIRNINICTKHGCRLNVSNIPVDGKLDYKFHAAENVVQDDRIVYEDNPTAIRYASYLESVFDAPMNFDSDIPISTILYTGMCKRKYVQGDGKVRCSKKLSEDMEAFYEELGIGDSAGIHKIRRVLMGKHFEFALVCRMGFFLNMPIEKMILPTLTQEQIQKERKSHYMQDATSVDWKSLDEKTAQKMELLAAGIYDGSLNKNGRPKRVSKRLVSRMLGLKLHQLENMPRCNAIFEKYTESSSENWARRIIWAYQKLLKERETFCMSDILLMSGVHKEHFPKAAPFLMKYTDEGTVEKIIHMMNG